MKTSKYVPTAIAALALAAIALPTAAHADAPSGTSTVKRPAIQELWNTNASYTVEHGTGYMHLAAVNHIGSASSATGFTGLTVVVTDEQGHQVCSTADDDHNVGGTWDCAFGPDALTAGTHTLRAVATNAHGVSSRPSEPVEVIVTADATVTPGQPDDTTAAPAPGPVDPGFTAGGDEAAQVAKPTAEAQVVGATDGGFTVAAEFVGSPGSTVTAVDGNGTETRSALDGNGHGALRWVVRGAADASFDAFQSENGWDSAKTHVVPRAEEVAADSTAVPAPGTIDQGFSVGTNADALPDPTVVAEDHVGSTRTIIAQVQGTPGATIRVLDANGDEHVKTMPASGSVLMNWKLGRYDDGAFSLQLELNGAKSKSMQIVPTH